MYSRRSFLFVALALPGLTRHWITTATQRGPGPHPTPRPGIDASHVLSPRDLADYPKARAAFDEVRQIPWIVDGIRCQCGCGEMTNHYSLLSCYEREGMARECEVCQGQGRLAFRLHKQGKTLDQIRAAVDRQFA